MHTGGSSSGNEKHPHGRGEDTLRLKNPKPLLETPPRAWGRPIAKAFCAATARNTPTGVGKTMLASTTNVVDKKHPHGRGEDQTARQVLGVSKETPPRAWGRHFIESIGYRSFATDSILFSITNFNPDSSIRSLFVSPMP